jgi:hypothetical protein
MPLLPIENDSPVLHIFNYKKKMTETQMVPTSWGKKLANNVTLERHDLLCRLDDPVLVDAKIDYQRYLCIQALTCMDRTTFSLEAIKAFDALNALLPDAEKQSALRMLSACGALKKAPSFYAKRIEKAIKT